MSSYFGFLFCSKNLRGIPQLKQSTLLGGYVSLPFIQRSPTRAVDFLRNHSLSLDSKTLSISYSLTPYMDSNHEYLHQKQMCYRYTIEEWRSIRVTLPLLRSDSAV